ncbi:MAG TPA: VWA domain-containing protein [Terriglobales bacterium]|nr:VWA domain-containing protein [Terriglobales bacterium]
MISYRFWQVFGLFSRHTQRRPLLRISLLLLVLGCFAGFTAAQDQGSSAPPKSQTDTPAPDGGPQSDVGPYAIPKKRDEPPPPPPPEKPKKIEGMPDYSIHVDIPLVEVPVMVTTKEGQFISNLKKENFRVSEDGTPQTISNFTISEAPITAVLLVEFAAGDYFFMGDILRGSYSFVNTLKKDDWLAVISYDMRDYILADFTQNKQEAYGALNQLRIPGFTETNLFDALYDTLDRVDRIEGHKYVILVTTGVDTFSKLNLDQITKKIKATKDVTIFPVSVGWAIREYFDEHGMAAPHGAGIPVSRMDYLQADNEMNSFAHLTGGRAYFPRFQAEFPEIFQEIGGDIRNQYSIAYHPTNPKLDGTYRKLKVEVVAPEGGPLKVKDQKGKDLKYMVIAREGYTAKHTVE